MHLLKTDVNFQFNPILDAQIDSVMRDTILSFTEETYLIKRTDESKDKSGIRGDIIEVIKKNGDRSALVHNLRTGYIYNSVVNAYFYEVYKTKDDHHLLYSL